MSEITDKYLAACAQRDSAYEKVVDVCAHIILLADVLQTKPNNVQITGISGALGVSGAGLSFDGSNWPSAVAVNNALAEYHQAIGAVNIAWTNIRLRNEEAGLRPPPPDHWAAMRQEFRNRVGRQRQLG